MKYVCENCGMLITGSVIDQEVWFSKCQNCIKKDRVHLVSMQPIEYGSPLSGTITATPIDPQRRKYIEDTASQVLVGLLIQNHPNTEQGYVESAIRYAMLLAEKMPTHA